ncbi:MAG: HDIG domain-containing protein, partial [Dactylosporangium sp.]|nr:HDIG domain-containing protein [Dactylosporangium sp.]NNJ62009.1 HDIG domain-containing protein [Dactylosporangium sp.]
MVATLLAPPVGVDEARALARELLTGDRLRHTAGVAARAEDLAETIGDHDAEILVVAAWVHDIGYGDRAVDTGFHPLDGARFLDGLGWPARISALVAHHSGARFVARPLGLAGALARYPDEGTAVSDALT